MKTLWIDKTLAYDGTQLRSLFAYLDYKILGDSVVSWAGPCSVSFEHMVDGEDLLEEAQICGDNMVHFIIEKFDVSLYAGVAIQRLFASQCIDVLKQLRPDSEKVNHLYREGDDIFYERQKLSISIATVSPTSTLIHFAVNITNAGTPVSTLSLEDLGVDPAKFAVAVMGKFSQEEGEIVEATQKVKWVR